MTILHSGILQKPIYRLARVPEDTTFFTATQTRRAERLVYVSHTIGDRRSSLHDVGRW